MPHQKGFFFSQVYYW